jgi:hypothetical protein
MISLRKAADALGVSLATVQKRARNHNFDTSRGLRDDDFAILKAEMETPQTETAEIVYLEPTFKLNLPTVPQQSTEIAPLLSDEQVQSVQAYVSQYSQYVDSEVERMEQELQATRERNQALQLEVHRLKELRKAKEAAALETRLEQMKLEISLGKASTELGDGK